MPRPISTVHITADFEKAYLRLPKHIQNLATRKDQWFRKDAFDPRLQTHKLKGDQLTGLIRLTGSTACYFDFSAQAKFSIMMSALTGFIASIASDSLNDWNGLNGWNDWNHFYAQASTMFIMVLGDK